MKRSNQIMRYIDHISHSRSVVYTEILHDKKLTESQRPYFLFISEEPGITQDKLSKRLFVHPSSVTRQLSLLERDGYIRREQDHNDRRVIHVYPTDRMLDVYPFIVKLIYSWNDFLLSELSDQEQTDLYAMLEKLRARASDAAERALNGETPFIENN